MYWGSTLGLGLDGRVAVVAEPNGFTSPWTIARSVWAWVIHCAPVFGGEPTDVPVWMAAMALWMSVCTVVASLVACVTAAWSAGT